MHGHREQEDVAKHDAVALLALDGEHEDVVGLDAEVVHIRLQAFWELLHFLPWGRHHEESWRAT